jgi:hypothetical protein
MNREIFNTGLTVETISLYLLCCGLLDAGVSPTAEMLRSKWNASEEAFESSLNELLEKRILRRSPAEDPGEIELRPTDRQRWRLQ